MTNPRYTLHHGDCLDVLPALAQVDAVICDPPYGTTRCSWDEAIPFDKMWAALRQATGKATPIVLFGTEPFSSRLRCSNPGQFKYDWVWNKPKGTGFLNAKKQPMRCHEMVSVFCAGRTPYNPQMTSGHARKVSFRGKHLQTEVYGEMANDYQYDSTERYPRSVITFSQDTQNSSLHPTQKPVELMRYLVRTYTQPGGTVLDFAMGSGTTGVAALLEGRNFIGVETEAKYVAIAEQRLREAAGEDLL